MPMVAELLAPVVAEVAMQIQEVVAVSPLAVHQVLAQIPSGVGAQATQVWSTTKEA
jgi:hypothetical protein